MFTRDFSGNWTQQTKLVAADGATYDFFGSSAALNGDIAVIGAPYDTDKGIDQVRHMCLPGMSGTWTQQAKLWPLMGHDDDFGNRLH